MFLVGIPIVAAFVPSAKHVWRPSESCHLGLHVWGAVPLSESFCCHVLTNSTLLLCSRVGSDPQLLSFLHVWMALPWSGSQQKLSPQATGFSNIYSHSCLDRHLFRQSYCPDGSELRSLVAMHDLLHLRVGFPTLCVPDLMVDVAFWW
jgi:hypothetical protein